MRKSRTHIAVAAMIIASLIAYLRCTPQPSANGGTETGDAVAMLYNPDNTPAVGALVRVYRADNNPAPGLSKTAAAVDSTVTDQVGRYSLTVPAQGYYTILGSGDGNLSFMDSLYLGAAGDSIPADTLHAPGSVRGVVRLRYAPPDSQFSYVLVFGTNTFTQTDNAGNFTLSNMAEGTYRVTIITAVANYAPLDTTISVTAGKDSPLDDTLWLRYTGIPAVQNLRISYDTLMQIVTLTWDRADTALVRSYNIYRRNIDSNTVPTMINTMPVTDTLFRDSTELREETFEYEVAAVGKTGLCGPHVFSQRVLTTCAYRVVRTIDVPFFEAVEKAIGTSPTEKVFVLCAYPKERVGVFVLDSNDVVVDSFGVGILKAPRDMVQDSGGNTYVCDIMPQDSTAGGMMPNELLKFSQGGELLWAQQTHLPPVVLAFAGHQVYVGTNGGVEIFDTSGNALGSVSWEQQPIAGLAPGARGDFLLYGGSNGDRTITSRSSSGMVLDTLLHTDLSGLSTYSGSGYLCTIGPDTIVFLLNHTIYEVNQNGELLARFRPSAMPFRFHLSSDGRYLWLAVRQGMVLAYERR